MQQRNSVSQWLKQKVIKITIANNRSTTSMRKMSATRISHPGKLKSPKLEKCVNRRKVGNNLSGFVYSKGLVCENYGRLLVLVS